MSQTHPSSSSDPKVIAGRYEVDKRLGAGAMGVVYKARDITLRRDVAIKTIRFESLAASQTASDELLERFRREARTAAQLKHPNIVTIYDIDDVEGLSYIAMEFIDGDGLERIIRESGTVPVPRAAGLAAQVADALGYAHAHGVIHRDIKPANIMVEAGERVKVTDFGIAKPMDAAENLTATGGLLGTPSYMSPEQARGQKIDGRSDLFSVGCVLYEMVTGRKAFSGETITAIIFKIIQEQPAPVRELNPLVPEQVARIIDKALAKTPEERYQTGRDMAQDLQALSQPGFVPTLHAVDVPTAKPAAPPGDAPTIATPPTARGTVSSRPTVAREASAETGATAPVPPTEVVPPPVPSAAQPAAPAPRPSRRPHPAPARRPAGGTGAGRRLLLAGGALVVLAAVAGVLWMVLGRGGTEPAVEVARTELEPSPPPTTPPAATESATPTPDTSAQAPAAPAEAQAAPTAPRETVRATPPPAPAAPRPQTTAPAASPRTAPDPPPSSPAAAAPPPGDDFLDELPEEAPDGRAAAQALAQQYSSGGSSSSSGFGSTSRFRRRPRVPPHSPAEKPAVATLAWIMNAENAHFRRTGRYGTLQELVDSGDLPLNGEWTGNGFVRRQYRFTLTASGQSFRADAQPLAPRGRAFYTDDSGFVLVAE